MKLLCVDVGNTEIKRAVLNNGIVDGGVARDPTLDAERVAMEIAAQNLDVALCSVRKNASELIRQALSSKTKQLAIEINHDVSNPVSGFYTGMGADRIADVCAAWSMHSGKPVAVIGLGTATTCTAASGAGVFGGGYITLGLGSICNSLTDSLPELPPIDPRQAKTLQPGFDVYSSICQGTLSAHVGIVEAWVALMRKQLGSELVVIATGGWSGLLAPLCESISAVEPHLTLKGIWTITRASGWNAGG